MGLAKAHIASMRTADSDTCVEHFDRVQTTLMNIMAGIADPRNKQFEVSAQETAFLEHIIDLVEDSFPRERQFILPGYCKMVCALSVLTVSIFTVFTLSVSFVCSPHDVMKLPIRMTATMSGSLFIHLFSF
jgi:hypothetical protein